MHEPSTSRAPFVGAAIGPRGGATHCRLVAMDAERAGVQHASVFGQLRPQNMISESSQCRSHFHAHGRMESRVVGGKSAPEAVPGHAGGEKHDLVQRYRGILTRTRGFRDASAKMKFSSWYSVSYAVC